MLRTTRQKRSCEDEEDEILYAQDIPHYGMVELEAEGDDKIVETAKGYPSATDRDPADDPDWNNPVAKRIVQIINEAGKEIAADVRCDNYNLEHVTDDELLIRDNARAVLEVLERAHSCLDRIADRLLYEESQPVTFLESRDIEDTYNDAICELHRSNTDPQGTGAAMTASLDNAFGMRCPKCGASDEIDIAATIWTRLSHEGTDVTQAANGDHEWEQRSLAACHSCGHAATVWDFNIENQPDPAENEARAGRAGTACSSTSPPRAKSSRTTAAKLPT